jgi:hypothetical protein
VKPESLKRVKKKKRRPREQQPLPPGWVEYTGGEYYNSVCKTTIFSRPTWGADYVGAFDKKGRPHGPGIENLPGIGVFKGEYSHGYRRGFGVFCSNQGDEYHGDWLHSLEHGHGMYKTHDGETYEGEWAHGMMHGTGTFIGHHGTKYEGEWDGGLRHGHGKLRGPKHVTGVLPEGWVVCQNKNVLTSKSQINMIAKKNEHLARIQRAGGEDDAYERNLYYFNLKAGCAVWNHPYYYEYEGQWKNNRPDGQGVAKWPDGRIYEGEWKGGFMHGVGSEYEANGDSYVGDWKNGVRHGNGTFKELKYGLYEGGFKNNIKEGFGRFKPFGAEAEEGYYRAGKRNDLPENWTEYIAKNKNKYYYNSVTKESTWEKPTIDTTILKRVRRQSAISMATTTSMANDMNGLAALEKQRAQHAARH